MRKNLLKIFGCCFIFLIPLYSSSQIPVYNDRNWEVDLKYSDEFDDLSKYDNGTWLHCDWRDCAPYLRSNIICNNGILELHTSIESDTTFKGSFLCSETVIPYGFFEIEMKIPNSYNHWHAFWMFATSGNEKFEIDHAELPYYMLQPRYPNYRYFTTNYHHFIDTIDIKNDMGEHYVDNINPSLPSLNSDFHKYAFEWTPERIIFYFDGYVIREVNDADHISNFPLLLKTGIGVNKKATPIVEIPDKLEINYIRVYHLNTLNCDIDAPTINNNSNLLNFTYSLYKNITIGNSSSNITLSTNETFRATGDITINGEFTVPEGIEICLLPTKCH